MRLHMKRLRTMKWLIFISKSCIFRLQKHKYDIVNGPLLYQKWPGNIFLLLLFHFTNSISRC